MTNDWKARLGMVYSTNPNFKYDTEEAPQIETLAPERQDLRVWLDRKQRGRQDRHARQRFRRLGCRPGGTGPPAQNPLRRGRAAKDGEIIIQGGHRDRVVEILAKAGYKCKKAGG